MYNSDLKNKDLKQFNISNQSEGARQKVLNEAESIFTWTVTPSRVLSDYLIVGFYLCISISMGVYMFVNEASLGFVLFSTTLWLLISLVPYFTMFKPQTYAFELTKHGVRVGTTDNAHEIFYSATRKAAWIGCIACVIAFFAIGPLAFAGGAAFALMAPKFTQFKRQTVYSSFHFHEVVSFKYHRKSWYMSIHPHFPTETRQSVYYDHMSPYYFFIEPVSYTFLSQHLKPLLPLRKSKKSRILMS
ncbi:hypothetical protein JCM19240_4532 [Vibrio maritimus]|uniref:Uncharacterized protein n=1 Tax=Vibrio maritimus TaxID=990268 RepID=A0A090TDI7_9VIBR|nr:hypothetical protein JCM19240_4532 [Vibrio maritimus]